MREKQAFDELRTRRLRLVRFGSLEDPEATLALRTER
jgi:hypothetical protein